MNNDTCVKVFTYENNDFVEVHDTFYSTDSHNLTFIKKNLIFKIEVPEKIIVGYKRERDERDVDHDTEVKKVKTTGDQKLLDDMYKLQEESNIIFAKYKKYKEQRDSALEQVKKLKTELLNARVIAEDACREKDKAIAISNKFRHYINDMNKKR